MLLSRFKRNMTLNWKYAVGEVVLIFVGISLSLVFDEWRQNKAKRENEKIHLTILMESVKSDIGNAAEALEQSELTLHTLDFLMRKLSSKEPLNDSIIKAFSYIVHNPQFAADKSGIKNLESSGMTIVSDLNLRVEINRYYGRVQSNEWWANDVNEHIKEYFNPRVITDFKDFLYLVKGIPYDYPKLQSDRIFLNALKRSHRLNLVSVDRIRTQKQHAEAFLKTLEEYVNR